MEASALEHHLKQDNLVSSAAVGRPEPAVSTSRPFVREERNTNSAQAPNKESTASRKREWKATRASKGDARDRKEDNTAEVKRPKIEPDQGHYSIDERTYLEGDIFYGVLEEEMPVQYWTGPEAASSGEKRLRERELFWKEAVVARIRGKKQLKPSVQISYLAAANDSDETLVPDVALDRIRIELGSSKSIPDTLEEARLLAMGGEIITASPDETESAPVDENTGFSGWTTVETKLTTVRQEIKEARARAREQRKATELERQANEKEKTHMELSRALTSVANPRSLHLADTKSDTAFLLCSLLEMFDMIVVAILAH